MKTTAASCKKGSSGFLNIALNPPQADRNAPRHLAEEVRGNCRSPASMLVMSAGIEGEIEASHLSTFSVRPCDVANSLTRLIWSLQSEMFVESMVSKPRVNDVTIHKYDCL